MDAKPLNKVIRSLNKATQAIEDQAYELCQLSNRLVEHVEFLEAEIKALEGVDEASAN